MKRSDPNWDEYTVRENLRALNFYLTRFEERRDVDDYDRAERHAEAVRPYLTKAFQGMSWDLDWLNDLYIGSHSLHGGDPGKCLDCRLGMSPVMELNISRRRSRSES